MDLEKYTGHLRLSLGIETTHEEIKKAVETLAKVVEKLRQAN